MVCNSGKRMFVSRTTIYRIRKEKNDLENYDDDFAYAGKTTCSISSQTTEQTTSETAETDNHYEPNTFVDDRFGDENDTDDTVGDSDGYCDESNDCDETAPPGMEVDSGHGSKSAEYDVSRVTRAIADCPLFERSSVSTSASNVLLMEYGMKHNLTLEDLLKLLKLLLPSPNNCPRSTYLFRKLFNDYQSFTYSTDYFCNNCLMQVDLTPECPKCKVILTNRTSSFIQIPMEQQLQKSLASELTYVRI